MKSRQPDAQVRRLTPLTDAELERVRRLAPQSIDICPTCNGCEKSIPLSGMKHWVSEGYRFDGEHHECNCQLQLWLYRRYVLANIGTQYMRLDWTEFSGDKDARQWVDDYVAKWKDYLAHGFGLTFSSPTQGIGKTWAATHVGKELIKQRRRVAFLDFTDMVDAFCEGDKDTERRLKETTFVILDDVRTGISERQTDLYALKFEVVVRHRTNFDLPTIFTTNLTEKQFEEEFPRIYSLIAPKTAWLEMNGVDYRKLSNTAAKTAEMVARGEIRPIT